MKVPNDPELRRMYDVERVAQAIEKLSDQVTQELAQLRKSMDDLRETLGYIGRKIQ